VVERYPSNYFVCVNPSATIGFAEAERSLIHDPIDSCVSNEIYLGQIGDGNKARVPIAEFMCGLKGSGLLITFRARDLGAIPQIFSRVPVATHPLRHRMAFVVSHFGNFNLCPLTYVREHPGLGLGTFTATVFAEPFLLLGTLKNGKTGTVSRRVLTREQSHPEALLFDYLIGGGQRMESSHVVDTRQRVILQYNHEAFDFNDNARDRRIAAVFDGTSRRISPQFWRSFAELSDEGSMSSRRIRGELQPLGREAVNNFFERHREVFRERRLGDVEIRLD